jgi:hypothetical protein
MESENYSNEIDNSNEIDILLVLIAPFSIKRSIKQIKLEYTLDMIKCLREMLIDCSPECISWRKIRNPEWCKKYASCILCRICNHCWDSWSDDNCIGCSKTIDHFICDSCKHCPGCDKSTKCKNMECFLLCAECCDGSCMKCSSCHKLNCVKRCRDCEQCQDCINVCEQCNLCLKCSTDKKVDYRRNVCSVCGIKE